HHGDCRMPVTVERQGDAVVVRIPIALKQRGGRKEVIVPGGLHDLPVAKAQEPLVVALARALAWQDLIETGRYGSIANLAKALGLDRCYVRRILNLAALAPNIVEAIVAGKEPSGLSLERIVKAMP